MSTKPHVCEYHVMGDYKERLGRVGFLTNAPHVGVEINKYSVSTTMPRGNQSYNVQRTCRYPSELCKAMVTGMRRQEVADDKNEFLLCNISTNESDLVEKAAHMKKLANQLHETVAIDDVSGIELDIGKVR